MHLNRVRSWAGLAGFYVVASDCYFYSFLFVLRQLFFTSRGIFYVFYYADLVCKFKNFITIFKCNIIFFNFILAVKEEMETIPAVPDNETFNEVEPIGEWAVV